MHRFEVFAFEKCYGLTTRVRSHSTSLEMTPFDRLHMTSYSHFIVTLARLYFTPFLRYSDSYHHYNDCHDLLT